MRRWLQITITAMVIFVSLVGLSYGSKMVTHDINSPSMAKNMVGWSSLRQVMVYLPDGYESNNYNYPVIYWIPGWNGSATDQYQKALDDAIRTRKIPATIAVFIDAREGILFLNSPVFGNGEDFLVKELIPFIDRTYRTIPDKNSRCIAGHSAGGFSAWALPILNPGIWGAAGTNDGMCGLPWWVVIGKDEIPESFSKENKEKASKWLDDNLLLHYTFPENVNGYNNINQFYAKITWQFAARITPNPNNPLFADFAMTPDGKWNPETREIWRQYSLLDPKGIAKHRETLRNISFSIIVVTKDFDQTNAFENEHFVEMLKLAGVSVTRLEMPGLHADYMPERFIALAESMLNIA
jgi:hypothetical protein